MRGESLEFANKIVQSIFLLIKDIKKTYNILNKLLNRKRELEIKYKLSEISKENYYLQLRKINEKILKLESKIYIYFGKIKHNISLLTEYIKENYSIEEESKKKIFESIKEIVSPILEYKPENQKIYSEISEIEEELSRAERIIDIDKIKKIETKKISKKERENIEDFYKIRKKIKKDLEKIDFYKIFVDISYLIFGKISEYILDKYPIFHYNLRKIIFKGKINLNPSEFLSLIFFSFFILLSIFLFLFIYLYEILLIAILFIFIFLFPIVLYLYINYKENLIKREIDTNLPFLSVHILSLLQTGIDIETCFRLVAETDDYGALSLEFKRLADLLNTGISISDAIEHVRDTTPSERFREFLDELLLTLRSGRNVKEFFMIYTENQLLLYRTDLEKLNQTMKNFSDLYVGLVLTVPMLIISVGIMLSAISPTIFGLTISEFLNLLSLVVLPMINLGVMIFISKLEI
ncbi:MAG: type II secretion system F family protein [Nanopusillaceae archaeon]